MIREATESDVQEIAHIYNHYIDHSIATFEETPINGDDISQRIARVTQAGFNWLVAVADGKVAGYAYASRWNTRAAYARTAEISVYLAPDTLAQGFGTKLYQALFESLQSKNIHTVIGGISLPNPASVALHEKFGMSKVAHFGEVGYKFGQFIDVGYWQVKINKGKASC